MSKSSNNQGEGDKQAARRYNEASEKFVESGGVENARATRREPSEKEQAELERAEQEGKARIAETDPAIKRDYQKPSN